MPNFKELVKSWNRLSYPWKPDINTLIIIEKKLQNSNNLAILGATPEFRLLAKQLKIQTDVYDLSIEMLEDLSVNHKGEKRIQKNWYQINGQQYDFILGDLIFGLIETHEQQKLLQIIYNNLSQNGIFVFRSATKIQNTKLPISESLKKYIQMYGYNNITWNYISFELTIGHDFLHSDILNTLNNIDPESKKMFEKDFLDICPYGNINYQNLAFQKFIKKSQYEFQKNHNGVREELIMLSKNELSSIL